MSYMEKLEKLGLSVQEVRDNQDILLDLLEELTFKEWKALVQDLVLETGSVTHILGPPKEGRLLEQSVQYFLLLSGASTRLLAQAIIALIQPLATLEEHTQDNLLIAENSLYIANYLELALDRDIVLRIATNSAIPTPIRRLAAVHLTFYDYVRDFWLSLVRTDPEIFLYGAMNAFSTHDPAYAFRILAEVDENNVEPTSLRLPLTEATRKLAPGTILSESFGTFPPNVREILKDILQYEEFSPQVMLDRSAEVEAKLLHFRDSNEIPAFHRLVHYIVEENNGENPVRPSLYYQKEIYQEAPITLHKLPTYTIEYLSRFNELVSETARQLGYEQVPVRSRPLNLTSLDAIVDSVFSLRATQCEVGFHSATRVERGGIIAVGEVQDLALVFPSSLESSLRLLLGRPTEKLNLEHIIKGLARDQIQFQVQSSTAVHEEASQILDTLEEGRNPLRENSRPDEILTLLIKNDTTRVALLDVLVAEELMATAPEDLGLWEIGYRQPLPTGFFVPHNDSVYASAVKKSMRGSIFDWEGRKWNETFAEHMQGAHVDLNEEGPKWLTWAEDVEGWVEVDVTDSTESDGPAKEVL